MYWLLHRGLPVVVLKAARKPMGVREEAAVILELMLLAEKVTLTAKLPTA